ncbi:MAG: hypothetical protein HYW22_01080 [Candidatus Aenigmarchaeota archaeon]|nr:hypothetical protein [Candidatus Aenigmarchaeota archaeon]
MKLKFKTSWIGIALIAIMLFSSLAGVVIQSFYFNRNDLELPKSNVIDYKMDPQVENYLLQNGVTVISFEYNMKCINCIQQKNSLEYYTNQYKTQIILQELANESLPVSKITATSLYGQYNVTNANDTGIFAILCNTMVSPPLECVAK